MNKLISILGILSLMVFCSIDYESCSIDYESPQLREEDLADETRSWCLLMITNGSKPTYEDTMIRDRKTLNLSNDQIEGWDSDGWSYWLSRDTKYR